MDSDKIIMFPTDRRSVEQFISQSNEYIETEQFDAALTILHYLEEQNVDHPVLYKNLLTCYIKTNRFIDAQLLCEHLLEESDRHYDEYLQYYFYILFERKKFRLLIDRIKKDRRHLPEDLREQVDHFHLLANEALVKEAKEVERTLKDVMQGDDYAKQIYTFEKWRALGAKPTPFIISLLAKEHVQPAVKTYILTLLHNAKCKETVTIEKFGLKETFKLDTLQLFDEHPIYKQTLRSLQEKEQHNPTHAALLEQLFDQFMYVIYPFYYAEDHIDAVVAAIEHIANMQVIDDSIHCSDDELTKRYIENITVLVSFYIQF